ncbi:MAG: indole-3-glycerol phosphate synthase TrpC [Oligoflexus sp.]
MTNKPNPPSNDNILLEIAAATRTRLQEEKRRLPLEELRSKVLSNPRQRRCLRDIFLTTQQRFPVIAEVKKASPSKGDIAAELDPLTVARDYVANGAVALSVLTEPKYFKGSLAYLRDIRRACPDTPILMKDFFVDEYQLYQALDAGADAILIIVALLGREGSRLMLQQAKQLGLSALVEVHDESELLIATEIGADLIGINSRNLKTMEISLDNILRLLPFVPANAVMIGESGIKSQQDLIELKAAGCHGFLIGTHFMATGEPGKALRDLTLGEL